MRDCLCISNFLSVSITPSRTYFTIEGWVTEWGLSWCSLRVSSTCVWVVHRAGIIININLRIQLKTKKCSNYMLQTSLSLLVSHWMLPRVICSCFLFKQQFKFNIWILISIFCRKCSDAPLHEVIASLPVETLQVLHMETIKMWKGGGAVGLWVRGGVWEWRRGWLFLTGRAELNEIVSHVSPHMCT